MKDKLDRLYARTIQQIAALNQELIQLTTFKGYLEQEGALPPEQAQMPVKVKGMARKRAPRGSIEGAILGVATKKGQTNAELRAALKANGYKYSLKPMPFAKALNRMADGNKLVKTVNGNRVEFTKP